MVYASPKMNMVSRKDRYLEVGDQIVGERDDEGSQVQLERLSGFKVQLDCNCCWGEKRRYDGIVRPTLR